MVGRIEMSSAGHTDSVKATSAKEERLNATGKPHANDAATSRWNVFTHRTAATTSRTRSTAISACFLLSELIWGSEFKQMDAHISSLQEQVDQLFANLNSLRNHVDTNLTTIETPYSAQGYARSLSISQNSAIPASPVHNRSKSYSKHPRFHGPTSSTFNLSVAKSSLQTMGITGPEDGVDEGLVTQDATPAGSPPLANTILQKPGLHASKDPIWAITKEEAIRLVHVWHEEMGMMYPFLDIDKITRYAELLFSFVEAASRSGLMQGALPGSDAIMDEQTSLLKLILSIAMTLEGSGKSDLGRRMFENVHSVVETLLLTPVDLRSINTLALTVRIDRFRLIF